MRAVKALVYWGCRWWCTWRNWSPASSSPALHRRYTTGNLWLWVSWGKSASMLYRGGSGMFRWYILVKKLEESDIFKIRIPGRWSSPTFFDQNRCLHASRIGESSGHKGIHRQEVLITCNPTFSIHQYYCSLLIQSIFNQRNAHQHTSV